MNNYDHIDLPDTDSPEVMTQAICLWMTNVIWEQVSRGVHPDEAEAELLKVYGRVSGAVREAHKA